MSAPVLTIALFHEPSGWSLPEEHANQIRLAAGEGAEVRVATRRADLLDALPGTTRLIGFPLTEEQFRASATDLEWVQLAHSSGDSSDALVAALDAGVRVTSATTFRAPQVAEHAMALTLGLIRDIDASVRAQEEHHWAGQELAHSVRTLHALTVGILSGDRIDDEIARRAAAFGASTLALRRLDAQPAESVDEAFEWERIDELVSRADVLIVAVPRMPSTMRLMNAARFAAMKPTALLVDVSRGGIVDESALLRAMRRKRIGGAGLDVFDTEPLAKSSPLWTMPNVVLTPHICAAAPDYWTRATTLICENVRRLNAGEPLVDELRPEWYAERATGKRRRAGAAT